MWFVMNADVLKCFLLVSFCLFIVKINLVPPVDFLLWISMCKDEMFYLYVI